MLSRTCLPPAMPHTHNTNNKNPHEPHKCKVMRQRELCLCKEYTYVLGIKTMKTMIYSDILLIRSQNTLKLINNNKQNSTYLSPNVMQTVYNTPVYIPKYRCTRTRLYIMYSFVSFVLNQRKVMVVTSNRIFIITSILGPTSR